MDEHPIEKLMTTALNNIKEMVNVSTVVGDPVETKDGAVIISVSRVSTGFAAGGAQYASSVQGKGQGTGNSGQLPFGGGSGAGVSVYPLGFLVVREDSVRFLNVGEGAGLNRLVEATPRLVEGIANLWSDGRQAGKKAQPRDKKQGGKRRVRRPPEQ